MKQNSVESGFLNAASAGWVPPTTTFASPPSSPATGSVYIFTDALFAGAAVGGGSALSTCRWSGSAWVSAGGSGVQLARGFGAAFDGSGAVLTTTLTAYVKVPSGGTITAWSIIVDTGTCTIKVWKKAAGTAIPTVSDNINTSGVAISSGTVVRSTTVSDFTTLAVADGDIIGIHIQAVSSATQINFQIELT
jgi:hypothetical protein